MKDGQASPRTGSQKSIQTSVRRSIVDIQCATILATVISAVPFWFMRLVSLIVEVKRRRYPLDLDFGSFSTMIRKNDFPGSAGIVCIVIGE